MKFLLPVVLMLISSVVIGQKPINWTPEQLMQPAELAAALKTKDVPVIISIGPGAPIPTSIHVGMVNDNAGMQNLETTLNKLDKNKKVVIYCGCCPFEHCPNVRPAINSLKEKKFTNFFLLNLPKNVKTDWIDKGYPTE